MLHAASSKRPLPWRAATRHRGAAVLHWSRWHDAPDTCLAHGHVLPLSVRGRCARGRTRVADGQRPARFQVVEQCR